MVINSEVFIFLVGNFNQNSGIDIIGARICSDVADKMSFLFYEEYLSIRNYSLSKTGFLL